MARRGENIYLRKDGRWEGRYERFRDQSGKIRYGYVYGTSYKETKKKLVIKKAEYFENRPDHNKLRISKTVEEWIEIWKTEIIRYHVKDSTYASYTHKLNSYTTDQIKKKELIELSRGCIDEMVVELKERGLSNTTINTYIRIFSECLNSAEQKGYLLQNPCRYWKKLKAEQKEIKALSLQEQFLLEDAAKKDPDGIVVLLPLFTGMRIGEISALLWEDIDFKSRLIRVNKTLQRIPKEEGGKNRTEIIIGPTKSNKYRSIPISDKLFQLLDEYRKKNKKRKYVISNNDSYCEPRLITYYFKRILKKVGLSNFNYHALRHTFATRCIESGVDVATLSRLLGHSSAKTTLDVYTDSMLEQRILAVNKLDQLRITNKSS